MVNYSEKVYTLIDYLNWRGQTSLLEKGYNDLDALLFSQLIYMDFSGVFKNDDEKITLKEAITRMFSLTAPEDINLGAIVPNEIVWLTRLTLDLNRYNHVIVSHYIRHVSVEDKTQFSALTFTLPTGEIVCSFAGTDDSLIGWEENCRMLVECPVPCFKEAVSYVEQEKALNPNTKIRLTGHSKGGAIALYAGMYGNYEKECISVHDFDGPFIFADFLNEQALERVSKVLCFVAPENDIIGRLLGDYKDVKIVKSEADGMYQHIGLNWHVKDDHFVYTTHFTPKSDGIAHDIAAIIRSMNQQQRYDFSICLYEFIQKSHKETLIDMSKSMLTSLTAFRKINKNAHKTLVKIMGVLIKYGVFERSLAEHNEE